MSVNEIAQSPRLPSLGTVVELTKPLTWFAPMWAYGCGVVSAGVPLDGRWHLLVLGLLLAGPLVCGMSQVINDWCDRHVDAINEPGRPIPSGRMPPGFAIRMAVVMTVAGLILAWTLGPWVFGAACVAVVLAWAYSAPPIRLKRNGWFGNAAVGLCYEGVPWFTGAAVMTGALPSSEVIWLAALYALGAHGIMTLNDFKSLEGDRAMGLGSLPAQLGPRAAAWLACAVMALPQAGVVWLLAEWNQAVAACTVAALLAVQLVFMHRLLSDPRRFAPWYNATGTSLYVLGMLASAIAVGWNA